MNNKALGLVLLVVGVILLVFGINSSNAAASEIKQAITGTPTDRSIWLIVGGAALSVLGLATAALGNRRVGT